MNRIYEKLKNNVDFKNKLKIYESENRLTITFNEYMRLDYIEGNYKTVKDEGVIFLNDSLTHWHITDDDEVFELLAFIVNGDFIFIEDTRFSTLIKLRIMERVKFEKTKGKYMTKKCLRIYTGNVIIKRID